MQQDEQRLGIMIVVVGASGAGKDTIIAYASRHFAEDQRVEFVRRSITRPLDAGGEDHLALEMDEFHRQEASGGFAVSWQAHGLCYGIPADTLERQKKARCLIVNGSRSLLPRFQQVFSRLVVVEITARPEILAARLARRGRESEREILARLRHQPSRSKMACETWSIDNSGEPTNAGEAFIRIIKSYLD